MNTFLKLLIFVGLAGAGGAAGYKPALEYWKERNRVTWETTAVTRGDLTQYVNSTGSVKPVLPVSIGSFVSGPIVELNVDFNDKVKAGDVLAKIDPRLFRANVDRDSATLATREAEVLRSEAQLQQALNSYARGKRLRETNEDFLSDREMDALVADVKALQAGRKLAKASVLQARASLENSQANLEYTDITSPVDGMVIDRKIEPGQTLAAQFQTPELFTVAPDLRKQVHIFASVDEADIGLIQKAQAESRPVEFNVDAHPNEVFQGKIEQIRVSSITDQNVVTYPVVLAASNPDLKLLPGMTATISFEVASKPNVLKVHKDALRFYPTDMKLVHPDDHKLLDASRWSTDEEATDSSVGDVELSASEKAQSRREANKRHVWFQKGDLLRAVEIYVGLSDNRYTEIVSGDLTEGDVLVTAKSRKKKK